MGCSTGLGNLQVKAAAQQDDKVLLRTAAVTAAAHVTRGPVATTKGDESTSRTKALSTESLRFYLKLLLVSILAHCWVRKSFTMVWETRPQRPGVAVLQQSWAVLQMGWDEVWLSAGPPVQT